MDETLAARAGDFQLETLLLMSQEHYEQKVWPLVYYIRKENRRIWQRNAAVALGNFGDPEKTPALIAALENPEPIVRAHAVWALGKLGARKPGRLSRRFVKPTSRNKSGKRSKNLGRFVKNSSLPSKPCRYGSKTSSRGSGNRFLKLLNLQLGAFASIRAPAVLMGEGQGGGDA